MFNEFISELFYNLDFFNSVKNWINSLKISQFLNFTQLINSKNILQFINFISLKLVLNIQMLKKQFNFY